MQDYEFDSARYMSVGGIVHRVPASITMRLTRDPHTGEMLPALYDEQGMFWCWDSPEARQALAYRHITITEESHNICKHCGSKKPQGQSCACFDNQCQ